MTIEKCSYGICEHTLLSLNEETHSEGVCWKITKPELAEEQTNDKYCPCKSNKELIRRYAINQFMTVEKHDSMVTKPCSNCRVDYLFRIHDTVCISCRTKSDYDQ